MSTIVFEGERFENTEDGRRMAAEAVIRAGYFDEDFEEYVNDHEPSFNAITAIIAGRWKAEALLDTLLDEFIEARIWDDVFVRVAIDDFCKVEESEE